MAIKSQNKIKIEGGMSSMTDLVFLLLIFFIIMSTMANSALPVDLPSSNASQSSSSQNSSVDVGLNANNQYFMEDDINRELSIEELKSVLQQKMTNNKESNIRLSADEKADLGKAVEILSLAKENQWRIVLVTKPK